MPEIEIEKRIEVNNKEKLLSWLSSHAKSLGKIYQKDVYFDPPHGSFIYKDSKGNKDANKWLRVRINDNKKDFVTFKKWHEEESYSDEYNFSTKNGKRFIKLMKLINFKEICTVTKKRNKWEYKNFILDYDKVEELSTFLEVELKGETTPRKGKEKIINFIQNKLKLDNWKEINEGYPYLIWNKKI